MTAVKHGDDSIFVPSRTLAPGAMIVYRPLPFQSVFVSRPGGDAEKGALAEEIDDKGGLEGSRTAGGTQA